VVRASLMIQTGFSGVIKLQKLFPAAQVVKPIAWWPSCLLFYVMALDTFK